MGQFQKGVYLFRLSFIVAFRKIAKSDYKITFVVSVCLSVRMEQLGSH